MDLGLSGRVAVITGASGGIGRALVDVFAAEGASLVLIGNAGFEGMSAWAAGEPWADRALCVRADTTDPDQVNTAFDRAIDRFGRVDVAVANAGRWPSADERLHEASVARIRDTVTVNLLGTTWTARAWMRALAHTGPREGSGAALVMIGSTAGRFGEAGHADYAMSKAGMVGLMLSLKNEVVHLDPFARVNLVEPGWTVTHMAKEALDVPGVVSRVCRTMPLRQLGRAVDVARATAFLCSDAARHVSGQTVTVAGGMEGRLLWSEGAIDEDAVRVRSRS